ncbi:hypothetical protein [Kocuria sp. NPDC057446]|uniref:hypothetical protein n=1 Tax=Kocuria sp. NPDC057446 TaxID=3346137 RepID=UPI0036B947AE
MDAQLDLQQLPRSTALRVEPTLPAVTNAVSAPPGDGTASFTRGVRRDSFDGPPRAEAHALRSPAGAGSCPMATADLALSVHESGPSTGAMPLGARSTVDRHRHPGRKTHVPDL